MMRGVQGVTTAPYSNAPQFGPRCVPVPEPLTMQEAADILAAAAATREDEGLAALLRAAFVEGV
jgi:hypothetical protein